MNKTKLARMNRVANKFPILRKKLVEINFNVKFPKDKKDNLSILERHNKEDEIKYETSLTFKNNDGGLETEKLEGTHIAHMMKGLFSTMVVRDKKK